jgi:hypothetical protein
LLILKSRTIPIRVIEAEPPTHPVKRVRQSLAGFSDGELNKLSKARNFARWIGRSESLLRNVENRVVPLSANLARRIAERTGVDQEWLLSDPPENTPIPAADGGVWDPLGALDPLVLGDHDFRNALPMAPELLLQLALAMFETACLNEIRQGGNTSLVRLMELIKSHLDLKDAKVIAELGAKLQQPGNADAFQLWIVARLAANQRRVARGDAGKSPGA